MNHKKPLASTIALAACSFALQLGDDNIATVQVTPAGVFYPADGRAMSVPGWRIDAAAASKVIERFAKRKTPLVIDYEHQTLRKEQNGQPAPAAAWFKNLEWREQGLFATVELTQRARDAIAANEYKYFSPVFRFDAKTGEVLELEMGAITNTPAIDGMQELTMRAAACFGANNEDFTVSLLQRLIAMMALADTTTEADALAALNKKLTFADSVSKALGIEDDAEPATVVAACTALKTKAESNAPDLAKFAPVAALTSLQNEVAALNAKLAERDAADIDAVIDAAIEDGRLIKGEMESWARSLAKTDRAALNAYLSSVAPVAALSGTQTNGKTPVPTGNALTDDERAVCSRMGISEEEFLKARA